MKASRWIVPLVAAVLLTLASSAEQWQQMSPEERERALHNYRRFQDAPEEERQEVQRQYERWQRMSPEERDRIRRNYQQYRHLPEEERREFNRAYRQWRDRRGH